VLLGFVVWYLRSNWDKYSRVLQEARPDWSWMVGSSFLVLVAYVVLIQTWRHVVVAWGERLSFNDAMRIWFVSNLAKYLPGRYWSIAAMGTLAQEAGISPVAAMVSSLVVQLVNLVTGFGVFFIAGARAMQVPVGAIVAVIVLGAALAGSPWLLPFAIRTVNRLTGRQVNLPYLPHAAIWWAGAGTTLAWCLYGMAFDAFANGMSGGTIHGSVGDWTAIFIGPYLLGFIAIFAPGGIGVREVAMAEALQRTGLAIGSLQALLVASSRIWLTVLEIIPGVLFLMVRPLDRPVSSSPKGR
jgi:hypothetical protein